MVTFTHYQDIPATDVHFRGVFAELDTLRTQAQAFGEANDAADFMESASQESNEACVSVFFYGIVSPPDGAVKQQ